ncbi:M23 family metallopeptidase [Gloeobacter kilaueensis]|uniref:Peptidase M23B n=1 Tax=Gloeobacter kilaueensis (strain ATCC BAA-2537 / CCAP 1431/1 / ULC 316 / JS1) TaxID=1183438 RepID=U5QFW4_GLOK1|nr:M23 family metallopeptidase [Gloeobacter kilaueensis]AGY57832.1 peptidase M23B [Gloeobacter kilaueensis JS1]
MGRRTGFALLVLLLIGVGALRAEDSVDSSTTETVRVFPDNPLPGNTLQIVTRNQVAVRFEEHDFPSFPIATGEWRALVPLSALMHPREYPLEVLSGPNTWTIPLRVAPRRFGLQRISLSAGRAALEATPTEEEAIGSALRTLSPEQFWQLPFRRPSGGRISSGFGLRRTYNGVLEQNYYHRGYDFAAPQGAGVIAPAAGRVVLVGTTQRGFRLHGNTLVLDHGQGVTSIYIHLSRILVRRGEMVKAGQRIALVGSSGRATGAHLHWGIYAHGVAIDPADWLAGRICCRASGNSSAAAAESAS